MHSYSEVTRKGGCIFLLHLLPSPEVKRTVIWRYLDALSVQLVFSKVQFLTYVYLVLFTAGHMTPRRVQWTNQGMEHNSNIFT